MIDLKNNIHFSYQRFQNLKAEKGPKRDLMESVNDFFEPEDNIWTGTQLVGFSETQGELLDTTGSDLLDEYVSLVLGLYYNTETRWFLFSILGLDQLSDDGRALEHRAELIYELIGKTNYYAVCPTLERNIVLQGHGTLNIAEDEENFADCEVANPLNTYYGTDLSNNIVDIYSEIFVTSDELMLEFEELQSDELILNHFHESSLEHYSLVSHHYPLENMFLDKQDEKNMGRNKYGTRYFIEGFEGVSDQLKKSAKYSAELGLYGLDKRTYSKFKKTFGTRDIFSKSVKYGHGMGKKALPKARILNKLARDLLNLSGLQGNPPRVHTAKFQTDNNEILLEPLTEGQVFVTEPDYETGEDLQNPRPVELLQVTGDLKSMLILYQQQQSQIADMFPGVGSIYKNARQSVPEIQQRLSEQEKRLAPLRANYLIEGTSKHLKRFYELAEAKGYFNEEKFQLSKKVKSSDIEFIFDSFLLGSYRQSKALRAAQALGLVANFLALQPSGADNIDIDKLVELAFAGNSVLDVLKTRAEVIEQRKQTAQQAEQQQQLQQQEANAKSASANAASLSIINELKDIT